VHPFRGQETTAIGVVVRRTSQSDKMGDYDKRHKIVLQTIMNEGALHEERGKELIIRLFDHNNTAKILSEINKKLRPLYMTVKCITCEVTGELYWVFVYTMQDKTTNFCSEFSQAELALLRKVYSEIVSSSNGYVSSTFCLNLCSSLNQKLTKAHADKFLHEVVDRKWLCCKNGKYYMGVRSIGELLQYFKDTHEDNLQTCTLCKQEVFYGKKCNKCNAIIHTYCFENYAENSNLGCPNCHHPISEHNNSEDDASCAMDIEVEESQVETDEKMTQSNQIRRSKRNKN